MNEKQKFRKDAVRLRKLIEDRDKKALKAAEMLRELPEYRNAEKIFIYIAAGAEISTAAVMQFCREDGKIMAAPRTEGERMYFLVTDGINRLVKGNFDITEPEEDCEKAAPGESDLIIVPGCAFSKDGFRMGYGKGYYDRFLSEHSGITAGFAFEEQVYDHIPCEPWDVRLDMIVTDKNVYRQEKNI